MTEQEMKEHITKLEAQITTLKNEKGVIESLAQDKDKEITKLKDDNKSLMEFNKELFLNRQVVVDSTEQQKQQEAEQEKVKTIDELLSSFN